MNGNLARRGWTWGASRDGDGDTSTAWARGAPPFIVRDRLHRRLPSSIVKYDHSKILIFIIGRKDVRRSPPLPYWMDVLVFVLVFAVLYYSITTIKLLSSSDTPLLPVLTRLELLTLLYERGRM